MHYLAPRFISLEPQKTPGSVSPDITQYLTNNGLALCSEPPDAFLGGDHRETD